LVPIICFGLAAICLFVNVKLALTFVFAGVISCLGLALILYYSGIAASSFLSVLL
jgi:hypothetical protein